MTGKMISLVKLDATNISILLQSERKHMCSAKVGVLKVALYAFRSGTLRP